MARNSGDVQAPKGTARPSRMSLRSVAVLAATAAFAFELAAPGSPIGPSVAAAATPQVASPADDTVGVGITGRADLPGLLRDGRTYEFNLQVMNPGSGMRTFSIDVEATGDPAAGWLTVRPGRVRLGPRESRAVLHRLIVPRSAPRAHHSLTVRASLVPIGESGAQAAPSAVSTITFTVAGRR